MRVRFRNCLGGLLRSLGPRGGCCSAGTGGYRRGVLQRQDRNADRRLFGGRRLRSLLARDRELSRQAHSRPAAHRGAEHAGRRKSLRAASHVYNVSPKDGTVISLTRAPVIAPLLGSQGGAGFDVTKFTWIGSGASDLTVCALLGNPKVNTMADALQHEFTLGGLGPGSDEDMYTKILRKLARHEGQAGLGLSGRRRDDARGGARRARRPLRLGVVEHQDLEAGLDHGARRSRC